MVLSDGMGSGEAACRESTLVVELLEELLGAGFPEKTAIQMINTTLVIGREEIHYSTVDMTVFDLYTGECEIIKAGASSTFIKKKDSVEHLSSTSLPIGVMNHIEIDSVKRQLEDGDFVIMVTDGVLDALPVGGAGYPAGDDHTGHRDRKSEGDGSSCAGAGACMDRERAGG